MNGRELQQVAPLPVREELLDSWKEIAVFLRRGVRTVQRWEKTEGLPVMRHHHLKRGSIYAMRTQVAAWRDARHGNKANGDDAKLAAVRKFHDLLEQQRILVAEIQALLEVSRRKRAEMMPMLRTIVLTQELRRKAQSSPATLSQVRSA